MKIPGYKFWITGFGRSGTKWLANTLATVKPGHVYHEPCIAFDKAAPRYGARASLEWWCEQRMPKMQELVDRDWSLWEGSPWYGEVNSLIRYHCAAIRATYPTAPLLHLYRDGRDVVRSLHARQIFVEGGGVNNTICPQELDPYFSEWEGLTRHQKLCWFWQDGIRSVFWHATGKIQFEKMTSDYDYFWEHVVAPTGVEVPRATWETFGSVPGVLQNTTKTHKKAPYSGWTSGEKRHFWQICGPAMALLGYT